ncbi:MAG TPA: RluA family pseudouridine synthase [Polyangiaceae bacterium]
MVGEGARERLDKVLARLMPEVSRSALQRWIADGRVLVDGAQRRARDAVGAGAVLEIDPGERLPSAAEPDAEIRVEVLYEDPELCVVVKPAGLVVHPARGHWSGTLVNGLLARPGFGLVPADPRDRTGSFRPGIVHRLDKDTSGLLVVAKTERAREALKAEIGSHRAERSYVALTLGVPRAGAIRTHYGRDPRSRLRFSSRVREGKLALTHVKVLEKLAGGRAALVECRLETGRTHQIRVHLSEQAGTPILGDRLYGRVSQDSALAAISSELGRQALHAEVLGFTHPTSGEALRFTAAPPDDFQRALAALRGAGPNASTE